MEKSRLFYKALWAGLFLAVIMGAGFFAQKSMAEQQKQDFVWALARVDMAYGQDIVARIDVPRLNRYALVTGENAPHGRNRHYAVWHGGVSMREQKTGTGHNNRLITGNSRGAFSFLRYLNEKDVLIFQAAESQREERYLVTDFMMSEGARVKIPALAGQDSGGEILLLATKYDYRNDPEGKQLYLIVIARRLDQTA